MPISDPVLVTHSKPFLVVDDQQTLRRALERLAQDNQQENNLYLIVDGVDGEFGVVWLPDMRTVIRLMGIDCLDQPLYQLPLAPAGAVIPRQTRLSSREILDKVATREYESVVVMDGEEVVGLFVNPLRAGAERAAIDTGLGELPGTLVDLLSDARSDYRSRLQPPTCPHCGEANFFRFDVATHVYICPHCGLEAPQP